MEVQFTDISGGQRQTPPRIFPPTAVEVAKNVVPSVDDSMFIVSPNVGEFLSTPDTTYKMIDGLVLGSSSGDVIYYIEMNPGASYLSYFLVKYDGSKTIIAEFQKIFGTSTVNFLNVKSIAGDIYLHSYPQESAASSYNMRSVYKRWIYNRFYTDYDVTEIKEFPEINIEIVLHNTPRAVSGDDVPILLQTEAGVFYFKPGYRIDGYQSIIPKNSDVGSVSLLGGDYGVHVPIQVWGGIGDRVTGVDLYGFLSDGTYNSEMAEDRPYNYLDTIPFDYDEEILSLSGTTLASGVISGGALVGKNFDTNQWQYFVIEYGGNYYPIASNTADTITLYTSVTGSGTVKIRSRWYAFGSYYRIAYPLTSLEGEGYILRTGTSYSKIVNSDDVCPPAKFIEYFKGFSWIAHYKDWNNEIRKNRLVRAVINSEGLVCQDVYNLADYIEFSSDITALKAMRDYMLVTTLDGVYTVRFMPAQGIGGANWSIKKISDIVFYDKKQISGIADNAVLWNNRVIYTCDGFSLTPIIDIEQQEILDEYMSTTGKSNNYYSIFYDQFNGHILLGLNDVIRYVKGIFTLDLDQTYNNRFIGNYSRDPVLMTDNAMLLVQDIQSGSPGDTFEVTFFNTDLNSKEDKYFITGVVRAYKSNQGDVKVEVYLDDTLVQTIEYEDGTSYNNYRDIFVPKSKSRRFTKMKFKVYTGDSLNANFKLKSIDVEFEPVRRTNIDGD